MRISFYRGRRISGVGAFLLAMAASAAPPAHDAAVAPPLAVEESDIAVLPPAGPHRIFLLNGFDGDGANVIDGDDENLKTLGLVPVARDGMFSLSRDGGKIFVTQTYWSFGDHGTRADLFTTYDGRTLDRTQEIALPGRLLVVPKTQQMATSDDERLGYVYDMLPSSSVHVVDLASGKMLSSVDLPGCALAFAYGARSFASLCGDGTLGTVTVPATGAAKAVFTKPFFKPDQDPVYENSVVDRTTGEGWFLTYSGLIFPAKLGATAIIGKPWSVNEAAGFARAGTGVQELAWRPGGGQLLALHRATRRLFLLMHPGNFWTHKSSGTEVWVMDPDRHTVVRRITLPSPVENIVVSQDEKPLLFAFSGRGQKKLFVLDAGTGEKLREREVAGLVGFVPGS